MSYLHPILAACKSDQAAKMLTCNGDIIILIGRCPDWWGLCPRPYLRTERTDPTRCEIPRRMA